MLETSSTRSPPPQWVVDLNSPPVAKSRNINIPDPPGFKAVIVDSRKNIPAAKASTRKPPTTEKTDTLKLKKAWEIALAPIKQLPMTAFMMYMSGNGLQIFSIMMVFMAFKNPIIGLMSINAVFAKFESEGNKSALLGVKIAYVAMQFIALGLGVWKVNQMGLLPTTRSDWLAWESAREPLEHVTPAL